MNDIEHDPDTLAFRNSISATSPLRKVYQGVKSFASLLIRAKSGDRPIGVITVASVEPWFFSESVRQSMQTLGERFYVALQHAKNAEAEARRTREIGFLLNVTPPLGEGSLDENLRSHVVRIARAASADVVSLFLRDDETEFLRDDETERFVLRGQHGWHDDSMVGKACYRLNEGLTGTLGGKLEALYVPDVAAKRDEIGRSGPGKYEKEMFGEKETRAGI